MRLSEVLQGTSPSYLRGDGSVEIKGVCLDSRRAAPGSLFIAAAGSRTDGNRHVKDAVARGAAAVMSELGPPPAPLSLPVAWVQVADIASAMGRAAANFHGDPSAALTVVGITGTKGKTSVSYLLEAAFASCGLTPGVIGTVSHRLSGRTLEKAVNTTPLAPELLALLARMRDGGATHVAMEVSSHALAGRRVDEVSFDAAVMTNLQSDHMDFHGTREAYLEAKARLFDLLCRAASPKKERAAVLNRDDESFRALKHRVVGARLVTFGRSPEADFSASDVSLSLEGTSFKLRGPGPERAVRLRLLGEHSVDNALAALAAAHALGLPLEKALSGVESLRRVPGRLEAVSAGQDFTVLVDYAHTEGALASVLSSLRRLCRGRLIAVFGCGGERDRTKRAPMGAAAARACDLVILTSDNPRSEDPEAILREIEAGARTAGRENYRIVPDRREAIREALRAARTGDAVLIAGKGHEDYQLVGSRSLPFDDREEAEKALRGL